MKITKEVKSFLIGTLAAGIFVLMTASIFSQFELNDFMRYGVLIITPIVAGAITLLFALDPLAKSSAYRILSPWAGIALWAVVALVVRYETLICIVMIAPFYAVLSSIGGLFAGWLKTKFRQKSNTTLCLAILPYIIIPIEGDIGTKTDIVTITDAIEINAPIETVWQGILRVPSIDGTEIPWNFSHFIGIPKPQSACINTIKVGGIREIKWQKEINFKEIITDISTQSHLKYNVFVEPTSIPVKELDTHIVVGDQYFDVIRGEYVLTQLKDTVQLRLSTTYRMTKKINFYGKFWAEIVFDDFHNAVLTVIKNRAENGIIRKYINYV